MEIIDKECLVTKCNHKYCGKCINQSLEYNRWFNRDSPFSVFFTNVEAGLTQFV